MTRSLILLAAAAVLATAAPTVARDAAPKKITAAGVDGIKLGAKHSRLYARGKLGRLRRGCELAGPGTRAARLRAPLKGTADMTRRDPRRVRSITVTGGATARGVGIGATIEEIMERFPGAKVDHGTDEVFLLTLVKVPRSAGGRIVFGVSTETDEITVIGVPYIAFCE
jgi:hypothetical protein